VISEQTDAASGQQSLKPQTVIVRLFELACVLVCFDHVATFIVNANHGIV
jgi:hypothetical protein